MSPNVKALRARLTRRVPVERFVTRSFIYVFSVTYSNDIYKIYIVIDRIDDAVIADPDSPERFIASQFSTACGARGYG
jgi:hypothetical protein